MTQYQQNADFLQPGERSVRGKWASDLGMVAAEAGIGVLALIAADSIYNLPVLVRSVFLGAGLSTLGVAISRAWTTGRQPRPDGSSPVVDRKRVIHRGILAGLLLAFFLGAGAVRPGFFAREMTRVLIPWYEQRAPELHPNTADLAPASQPAAGLSAQAAIEFKVEPGNTQVQRGDSLRVVAMLNHATGPVLLRFRGSDNQWHAQLMPVDPAQPEKFTDLLRNVSDDLTYQAVMGTAASPVYTLRVYDVASLKAIRLSYKYPPSVGLPDRSVSGADGNIEAVEGTRVEVTLVATGPLRSSSLLVDGGQALPMAVSGQEATRTIEILRDGEYRLLALDARGTPLDLPGRFGIHALHGEVRKIEADHQTIESSAQPME